MSEVRKTPPYPTPLRLGVAVLALAAMGACTSPGGINLDFRDRMGARDTGFGQPAAAAADRPSPDARGVISYPEFQVAVARRGDTVADVAARVGLPAGELADYNGLQPNMTLRDGEVLSLPRRVQADPADEIDISALAGSAIDRADGAVAPAPASPAARQGASGGGLVPVQHQVRRGETAYSIARLYNVSVRSLADWNGLGPEFEVREGQFLLIPVTTGGQQQASLGTDDIETTPLPGEGSPTPTPPSAAEPLPEPDAEIETAAAPPSPALAQDRTEASGARLMMPVNGPIISGYNPPSNEGIDISASPGTPVRAAGAGTVAAITRDTDQVPILVIRHSGDLLTVYANIQDIRVEKGDTVAAGQTIATVRASSPSFLHFEVREGFESVDPVTYVN